MGFLPKFFSRGAPTGHTVREPGCSLHVDGGVFDGKLLESVFMRITEAARRLGTSARMLRYREDLGLLPQVRERRGGVGSGAARGLGAAGEFGATGVVGTLGAAGSGTAAAGRGAAHRVFTEEDVEAVAA